MRNDDPPSHPKQLKKMFSICRQQVVSTLIRCTGRNFCVYKIVPRINASVIPKLDTRQCLGVHNLNRPCIRYYSKKEHDDDDDECEEKKKKVCKPKPIKECVSKEGSNKKQLPYLQECARPNLMSDCPKPDCPHEPEGKGPNKNLLLGLLALLGALAGIWYMLNRDKKDVCTIPSKMMLKDKKKETSCLTRKPPVKEPKCSDDIPNSVPYLLIGGGTAAFSAFRAIKSSDPRAKVLVVTDEENFPYMRPPLSKELWYADGAGADNLEFKQWNGAVRSLYYEPNEFYLKTKDLIVSDNGGVAVARGWTVTHLDVPNKKAYLEDGYEIAYDKVLIATGSKPKNLDVIEKGDECVKMRATTYRTVADFQYLSKLLEKANSVTIIGGGFLGSELACALGRKKKFKVYQIFKEKGHMGSVLPEYLSTWTTEKVRREGVEVYPSTEVVGAAGSDKNVTLKLSNGKSITSELVIVAVGAVPETGLASKSCLEVDHDFGGYLVNTELMARSNVYVAGDSACFYDPSLGRRRIEHHDNAVISGRLAGENMTGASKPYNHQSMFWSDLGPDIGYEAIGLVHSSLPTVGVFAKVSETKEEIPDVPPIQEVPESCMSYLPPEEEEKQRKLKAEYEEKLRCAEEAKKKAQQEHEQLAKEAKDQPSPEYNKGVIFYLRDDIIVGIVLWNVFNRMGIARQVLKDQCKYEDLNEVAKLFNIHEEE